MPKRTDAEIIRDLQRVECELSPENLCCDGELRGKALLDKAARLNRQRAALVKELGREPTDAELWNYQPSWA
jgi:hypothetical protein